MSSPLAIAAVTGAMKNMLMTAVNQAGIGTVDVTTKSPDRAVNTSESAKLNLFMYRVAPNQGWSNTQLPSRNDRGERLTNPYLALDLFYVLSAYEQKDYDAEILLGYGMQVLHETPVLTRQALRDSLQSLPAPLDTSDIPDQVEMIKITMLPLTLDELAKLWSAFQTNFRPSAVYHVSVVLLDSKKPARSPLPVLARGEPNTTTGRDQGVALQPNLLPPYPVLQEVLPPNRQPAILLSTNQADQAQVLTLRGHRLDGTSVAARFKHIRTAETLDLPVEPGNTAIQFQVKMPVDPPLAAPAPQPDPHNADSWLIGYYTVAAVVQRSGETLPRVTNELPVTLAPRLIPPIGKAMDGNEITFTATCSPKVRKSQSIKLVISDRELTAEPLTGAQSSAIEFKTDITTLPTGTHPVRLIIDGVESLLVDRTVSPPRFDPSQQVTIP